MMRAWQFVLVILLLLPLLDAQQKNKGKGGKNQNKNKNPSRDDAESAPDDMGEDTREESVDDREGEKNQHVLQLPRNTMLMEDAEVEMGRMYKMHSGEANCRVSCKGSVSGMTDMDPRYPYYKYINVDITGCYDDDTLFPQKPRGEMGRNGTDSPKHFSDWEAAVTRLHFYKVKDSSVKLIPKRLSMPTEVHNTDPQCGKYDEECRPSETSFGFAVFIPRYDMQVKWRVDWEVNARSPYVNMDDAEKGDWNYGDCEGVVDEYMEDRKFQSNAFSIDSDEGYSFWRPVHSGQRQTRQDRD